MRNDAPRVGLYITCLIDIMRPSVAFAVVKSLEDAGVHVSVPPRQTCCGQPALNAGDTKTAQHLARTVLDSFEGFDYVVVPSGSCAGMLRKHVPELMADTSEATRAQSFSNRVFEFTEFLDHIHARPKHIDTVTGPIAFHESCSAKRELNLGSGAQDRVAQATGADVIELPDTEVCCGFGGMFSVSFPEISNAMVSAKTKTIKSAAPAVLTGCELGCLMNLAGKLHREGARIDCRHVAEILAGDFTTPAIGASGLAR